MALIKYNKENNMWALVFFVAIGIALGFLANAGFVWIICWALNAIGIHTIGGWTVQFSWPLVVIFTLVCLLISGFFANARKDK